MKQVIITLLCIIAVISAAAAPRVSLLTAMPGSEIYELEGHTGLRISDPEKNVDAVINWGVYDFNEPNFVGRFTAGKTDYMCVAVPTALFLADYERQGRAVIEQTLRLDSLQTTRLIALVDDNLQPKNRTYRYNYVLDNCATRPLELIETAIGRKLLADTLSGTTFRKEMQRFHRLYPWYQFGIDLALGRGLDREITVGETAFAPVTLMALLDTTDIVESTTDHGAMTLTNRPTPLPLTPVAVSVIILIAAIIVSLDKGARIFDTLLFGAFFIAGCIVTFLVFFSSHEATSPNLLLLWLNPLCLLGAVLPWLKSAKKLRISYFFVNFALLIILAILAPALGRAMNAAFWPLIAADALRSICNILKCKKTIRS